MMENTSLTCFNCSKSVPVRAKFCGHCMTQLRCKDCNEPLEKEAIGCIECGAPISNKNLSGQTQHFNTITFTETPTERTFQASFSDAVGKELTGIVRDTMNGKRIGGSSNEQLALLSNSVEDAVFHEVPNEQNVNNQSRNDNTPQSPVEQNIEHSPKYTSTEILPLKTVAMRGLPASEVEWVLIHAYYASDFGKKAITRADIISKFKEIDMWNDNKSSALSGNIQLNVRARRMNAFGKEFAILDAGIKLAQEILTRTESSVPQSRTKKNKNNEPSSENQEQGKKKKASKSSGSHKRLDIDFRPKDMESLESYFAKFPVKSDLERILVFVSYLKTILGIESVSNDHIYTCFDELQLQIPNNLEQTVRNVASKKHYIDTSNSKSITLVTKGINKLRHWDKYD